MKPKMNQKTHHTILKNFLPIILVLYALCNIYVLCVLLSKDTSIQQIQDFAKIVGQAYVSISIGLAALVISTATLSKNFDRKNNELKYELVSAIRSITYHMFTALSLIIVSYTEWPVGILILIIGTGTTLALVTLQVHKLLGAVLKL